MIKVGDYVCVTIEDDGIFSEWGRVLQVENNILVEFDNEFDFMHNARGKGKVGHCWYVASHRILLNKGNNICSCCGQPLPVKKEVVKPPKLTDNMMVELKDGSKCIVFTDVKTRYYGVQDFILVDEDGFHVGSDYNEMLIPKDLDNDEFSIMKIYTYDYLPKLAVSAICDDNFELIWSREDD